MATEPRARRQFTIRELLALMFVLAILLALGTQLWLVGAVAVGGAAAVWQCSGPSRRSRPWEVGWQTVGRCPGLMHWPGSSAQRIGFCGTMARRSKRTLILSRLL